MNISTKTYGRSLTLALLLVCNSHLQARETFAGGAPNEARPCEISEEVSGDVRLETGCVYRQQFRISTSATTLDCRGAWLDGGGTLANGVVIDSKGTPLVDVIVKNCNIRGYETGARVAWVKPDDQKGGSANAFANAPSKVTLSHLHVVDSGRVGIYIDDHVHQVTIKDSTIEGSGGVGMYLEYGTSDNHVLRNKFIRNGRAFKREGLAIDSSRNNLVSGNLFEENERGGIFLYKNCGEHVATGRSVPRTEHSDHNVIQGNTFSGEKVGVWIASRQSVELKRLDCSDRPMDARGSYYEDFANFNNVTGNAFCGTKVGIRVEGDNNTLTGNSYDRSTRKLIDMPVSKRAQLLGRPSTGNQIDAGKLVAGLCQ